ncbi:DEAD-box ATP-dependent RNA helicase FANCM [Salvia splendens]|uniref:DEAD-box ATP-dependent RNA helicase FANCM n=1 Tax=Salvia splendens TaxID=180675 RepID=UPI001C25AE82|nr:DEAD-box ATP-dependent RNA helicase FANCM [Salvia splendens]
MDDDDEFDWEAAVHEIDVACQAAAATAVPNSYCKQEMFVNVDEEMRKTGKFDAISSAPSTRQTTLDRFIGAPSFNSRKFEERVEISRGQQCMSSSIGENICQESEKLNEFVKIDAEAAKTWIYPVNVPVREYQLSITRTALFANTLVALPTGLGKTLIAAVVIYNFFRWFPEGKIVFAAPSRPLVLQQIEACHKIVGIPQEWTIDLTGQKSPSRRAEFWKCKRVFFVTSQVLEKDIHSGSCLVKNLVCLVIDEAHHASGNYSYCVAVRELMDASTQLRILGLSATPGSNQKTIQHVIDNLQISTLEYRSESDPDVQPYVHDRKIELIQVSMGDEAIDIDSLLLEVGRPYHAQLCSFGLLPKRDFKTLSPCDFLRSKETFRKKPPASVPLSRHGEFMGYFAALVTLHHLRKLLSSHGIRPAFEMLDEKLKKGWFARLLSRNEAILKAKLIMQKTITHGARSPKLTKMLEVLTEHFKVKDPKNSRVIIFSNFRGSVRDILDALKHIGESVKATEFIGQNAGKNSKGQSQKIQQAVLEKFRTGGYNVIVATSIGEEGLDIMEVDLVICFDANISPLRMIQRMGRTGRNQEGRVVVLACEGAELRGYKQKLANGKSISKHMIHGGTKSFNFHPSPRMVPHFLKPELQFLEMSIEEFVPCGSKAKDSELIPGPAYKEKITDAEKDSLAKYFVATQEDAWRPSLIAFPHFQAYPSPANSVLHSSRTQILIDTMQDLQDLPYSHDRNPSAEDDVILDPCLRVSEAEPRDNVIEDSERYTDPAEEESNREAEESGRELQVTVKDLQSEDSHKPKTWLHTFLFASEFVSVDSVGNVLVLSLPQVPLDSSSKRMESRNMASLDHSMHECVECAEIPLQPIDNQTVHEFSVGDLFSEDAKKFDEAEEILHSPVSSRMQNEMDISDQDLIDVYLSPRLTNLIKSGVVPESPINDSGTWKGNQGDDIVCPALVSPPNLETERLLNSCEHDKREDINGSLGEMDIDNGIRTPPLDCNTGTVGACSSPVPITNELRTPVTKLSGTSSSKDWTPDCGVQPESVEQPFKFRRLRKLGDCNRKVPTESRNSTGAGEKYVSRRISHHKSTTLLKGEKKQAKGAATYIEEEAEVSSDAMASDDEEDVQEDSSFEDSFIDDGLNPTTSNTQAGSTRVDMMAIYRRSLLSQSPFPRPPSFPTNHSPDSVVQSSKMDGSGSSTGTGRDDAPQTGFESTARNNKDAGNGVPTEMFESRPDSRKRKLSLHQAHSLPTLNLDTEFSLLSGAAHENSTAHVHVETMEKAVDIFEDDDFYEGIDLDALEEEATKLFKKKTEHSTEKIVGSDEIKEQNFGIFDAPSFDLGF